MLEVEGVTKRYGSIEALRGIDLTIRTGEVVALIGRNGAGKTTFASIVAGLRRPDFGSVRVNGIDVVTRPYDVRQYLGLAPQELGIYPAVTVRENLILFGELSGVSRRRLPQRINEVCEALELTALIDRRAATLSGGEKRRLHTAIAIVHSPPLLLLDEPTAGADVQTRHNLLRVVEELRAAGTAVCYCTHYLHEIEALDASVVILEKGHVVARGDLSNLIAIHGKSAVELSFDGVAPRLDVWDAEYVTDSTVRIRTDDPAATSASILASLGPDGSRLRSIEIAKSDLESVFLELTGSRIRDDVAVGA